MTIEELDALKNETVYLEYRYPSYNSGYRKTSWIRAWLGSTKSTNRALYGITWRCWEKKPTEEESKAVEWRERDGR